MSAPPVPAAHVSEISALAKEVSAAITAQFGHRLKSKKLVVAMLTEFHASVVVTPHGPHGTCAVLASALVEHALLMPKHCRQELLDALKRDWMMSDDAASQ